MLHDEDDASTHTTSTERSEAFPRGLLMQQRPPSRGATRLGVQLVFLPQPRLHSTPYSTLEFTQHSPSAPPKTNLHYPLHQSKCLLLALLSSLLPQLTSPSTPREKRRDCSFLKPCTPTTSSSRPASRSISRPRTAPGEFLRHRSSSVARQGRS